MLIMYLVMRLNGQELERELFLPGLKISEVMKALRKKYKVEIEKTGQDPEFFLKNVPSSVNGLKVEGRLSV